MKSMRIVQKSACCRCGEAHGKSLPFAMDEGNIVNWVKFYFELPEQSTDTLHFEIDALRRRRKTWITPCKHAVRSSGYAIPPYLMAHRRCATSRIEAWKQSLAM